MENQLNETDYIQIHKELTQENGIWTARIEDNCSQRNAINRLKRLKSLNYFLFKSLSEKPYDLWPNSGHRILKQDKDENDFKKCICGHKIWDYTIVESIENDRAYIGMCCIRKFDKGWNKIIREGMKKCPCGKKKLMTDTHCKNCRNCVKCNIIKPMKRLYDNQCITCSEEAEQQQREQIRINQLAKEREREEFIIKNERKRIEYITSNIKILKEASTYARNDWEKNFTSDLMKKFIESKKSFELTDKQEKCVNRILTYGRFLNSTN
jgi:hypothetical protein